MKKARGFDNVLDQCLEHVLAKGEAVEECLRSFPEHADMLKPLLQTALAIKGASAIQPRPEFRDKARYQLQAAFQERGRKIRPFLSLGWQPRWATATVAIILALLLAGSGTVAAASGSMPDEPLYTVKLATEQVQLALTPSALGKAELYAKMADKRVYEIVRMASESKPEQIEQTTWRLDTYLTQITVLASTHEMAALTTPAPTTEAAREAQMLGKAPAAPQAVPAPKEAPKVEERPSVKEAPLPAKPAEAGKMAGPVANPREKLKTIVIRQAQENPALLRAALEKASPQARQALQQAIALSEKAYERVLESFD